MSLILDVPTRWNSTYLILGAALKYQKAFELFEEQQAQFTCELVVGPPTDQDWNNTRVLVRFLKRFYDATNRKSDSRYVTANSCYHELFKIEDLWRHGLKLWILICCNGCKYEKKFDKYWRNIDKVNMMLLIAILLDPWYNLRYVRLCYVDIYEFGKVEELVRRSIEEMKSILEYYKMIDFVESSASSRNWSFDGMEVDKPDCESSDILDSAEEDDIEKRIKAKYKLLLQE